MWLELADKFPSDKIFLAVLQCLHVNASDAAWGYVACGQERVSIVERSLRQCRPVLALYSVRIFDHDRVEPAGVPPFHPLPKPLTQL
jgi:hypothetical protein